MAEGGGVSGKREVESGRKGGGVRGKWKKGGGERGKREVEEGGGGGGKGVLQQRPSRT